MEAFSRGRDADGDGQQTSSGCGITRQFLDSRRRVWPTEQYRPTTEED
jgi:hypothetical protein